MQDNSCLFDFDKKYEQPLAGVDEAGRGPWAGPVVAAAVVFAEPDREIFKNVNDSKKLSEKKREELFKMIIDSCDSYSISEMSNKIIDETNILAATLCAMKNASEALKIFPVVVLVDGISRPDVKGATCVKQGDSKSFLIAAASILAKVYRDRMMKRYAEKYPVYGFEKHKGYGTAAHAKALKEHGPCEIHRMSYKPIKQVVESRK